LGSYASTTSSESVCRLTLVRILGVIPARMAAQRFPGKPLADLAGRPLIQWVYESAAACEDLDELVVATPDPEIVHVVEGFGGFAELTRTDHPTGTDRVAEIASRRHDGEVIVNVQGDQPFVTPDMLSALVQPYRRGLCPVMTTVAAPLDHRRGPDDSNAVKVVCDRSGNALYFSRAPIPFRRNAVSAELPVYHHVGLYAFTREFLATYASLSATPLEECEGLEQLRVLEHGHRITVCPIERPVLEVNTPEDLVAAATLVERRGTK
jgi:3-deoxy-manno-octulosonate cytidylyltransferase (CMP-KDO synthetase)